MLAFTYPPFGPGHREAMGRLGVPRDRKAFSFSLRSGLRLWRRGSGLAPFPDALAARGASKRAAVFLRGASPVQASPLAKSSYEPKTYPFVKVYILAIGRLPFLWGKRLGIFLLDRTSRTTCK